MWNGEVAFPGSVTVPESKVQAQSHVGNKWEVTVTPGPAFLAALQLDVTPN